MSSKYIETLRRVAKLGALDAETAEKLINAHAEQQDGGPGSGNFGHKGRPGKKGGSAKEGAGGGGAAAGGSSSYPVGVPRESVPESFMSRYPGIHNIKTGPTLRNVMREPAYQFQRTPPPSQKAAGNLKAMEKAKQDMAQQCARMAAKWPEGSEERQAYLRQGEAMQKPFSKRPTPQESEALTKKFMSNISGKLQPYAVERYKRDLANEPKITNDLCDIADEIGTGMFGLDYRLKKASDSADGRCRIADKIAEDMDEKGLSYEQATDGLSDMVRYTQACTAKNLVSNFEKTKAALEKKGYKPVKVKNTWKTFNRDNAYRGVNCVFESPEGTRFELQFHTPESLVGKEVQHGWYEEQRNPDTPQNRKDELGERMYRNMAAMKEPVGIEKILPYPPK